MFTNMLELFCMARGVCPLLCVRGCWYSLEKVLWEQSGKVDSHKQANLRHLLREALESLVTVLQFCTAHHKLCVSSFFYYYSPASGRICCVYYGWVLGLSKGRGTTQFKMGLSVPIRPLCVFVKNNATEGAFQRKRHIQLADIQCAKEVKLLRTGTANCIDNRLKLVFSPSCHHISHALFGLPLQTDFKPGWVFFLLRSGVYRCGCLWVSVFISVCACARASV